MAVKFIPDDHYQGKGLSQGLGRGLAVLYNNRDVRGLILGLSAVALRKNGRTCFPGMIYTVRNKNNVIIRNYLIDRVQKWSVNGKNIPFLTKFFEFTASVYMASQIIQKIISPGIISLFIKKLKLRSGFKIIRPVACVRMEYRIRGSHIKICGSVTSLDGVLHRLYIMNELDAGFLNTALMNEKKVPLPSGWVKLQNDNSGPVLCSHEKGLIFSTRSFSCLPEVRFLKFWGREKSSELCWTGFEYAVDMRRRNINEFQFSYEAVLKER